MINKFLIILFLIVFTGCSYEVAQLSLASTTITEINGQTINKGTFKGKDQNYIIFLFPIGFPKIDDAIDNTLNDNNLDYLTDITISEEFFWIPYLFGYRNYNVYGKGWVIVDSIYHPNSEPIKKFKKFSPMTGKPVYE